jgi:hypothetical protein
MLAGFLQVTGDKVLAPERVSVWLNSRARSGQQCACVKVTRHKSVRRCFQRNDVVLVEDGGFVRSRTANSQLYNTYCGPRQRPGTHVISLPDTAW